MKPLKFCLLDADYSYTEKKVRLFGVDSSGKSVMVIDDFDNYFYALDKKGLEAELKTMENVKRIKREKRTIGLEKKSFLKVFTDDPDKVRKNTTSYEYSITPYRRYLIDKKLYPLDWIAIQGKDTKGIGFDRVIEATSLKKENKKVPKMKIMAFDIEFIKNKIVMLSVSDNKKYRKVFSGNEKKILQDFEKVVQKRDPDIIVSYNGDLFDLEIIKQRAEHHKLNLILSRDGSPTKKTKSSWSSSVRIPGRINLDLYTFVSRLMFQQLKSEVLTLKEVSKELIGDTKEEHTLEELHNMWNNDKKKMEKYCQHDSDLTLKLCKKLLTLIFEISRISGQLPFSASRMTFGTLSEWFLVRKAAENKVIMPNNPHFYEMKRRREKRPFQGAYVKEPVKGLHKNIAVFDFRSLYPSVIVSLNLSPETLNVPDCKKYNKVPGFPHEFCADKEGFVPKMVREILKERAKVKKKANITNRKKIDEQQFSLKILANATYGMFANANARWYSYECAESSAAFGRHYIKETIKKAEKEGFIVLYSDTDSLFVKLPNEKNIKSSAKQLMKKINSKLPDIMELDLEGFYTKGLFVTQKVGGYTAKKRYALLDEKGNVTVRGMEAVRRDWCSLAKELQKSVLKLVLSDKETQAVEKVKKAVQKLRSREVGIEELAVTTQLSRPVSEYKVKNPQSVLGKRLEKQGLHVKTGTILKYIIKTGKGTMSDRAEFAHKASKKDYDIDYYVNKQIIPVALRVLQPLGYTEESFEDGLKRFTKK